MDDLNDGRDAIDCCVPQSDVFERRCAQTSTVGPFAITQRSLNTNITDLSPF